MTWVCGKYVYSNCINCRNKWYCNNYVIFLTSNSHLWCDAMMNVRFLIMLQLNCTNAICLQCEKSTLTTIFTIVNIYWTKAIKRSTAFNCWELNWWEKLKGVRQSDMASERFIERGSRCIYDSIKNVLIESLYRFRKVDDESVKTANKNWLFTFLWIEN